MMGMLQDPPVTALDFGQDACSLESEDVRRLMRDLTAHAQGAQPEVSIDWTFAWPATMKEYPSWLTCFGNWLDAIKPVVRLLPFELDESTRANPYFALREKKGEFWSTQTIEGETVAREYDRLKSGVTSVVAMNQHGTRATVTAFADSVQDHLSQVPSPEAAPEHREVYLCDQGGHIVPIAFIRTNGSLFSLGGLARQVKLASVCSTPGKEQRTRRSLRRGSEPGDGNRMPCPCVGNGQMVTQEIVRRSLCHLVAGPSFAKYRHFGTDDGGNPPAQGPPSG
jgi:hypothetical protein